MSAARCAQRRHGDLDHVEAVEQVFAEPPGGDCRLQVAVGGGEDANVAGPRLGLAHALVAALLQQPQELGLQGQRQVADFVEEERAPFGRRDLADRVADRAGKGPQHVAEQFAFQQLGGKAGAVHRDEGTVGPLAAGVDRAGQHALARAALAANEDRGLAWRPS